MATAIFPPQSRPENVLLSMVNEWAQRSWDLHEAACFFEREDLELRSRAAYRISRVFQDAADELWAKLCSIHSIER